MIKRIAIFTLTVFLLFVIGYFSNVYFIEKFKATLQFSLLQVYLFQAIATALIYVLVELVVEHLPNETGYLYLALTMMKMGVFILFFQESIFSDTALSKADKSSLLIPFFIFLIAEAVAVAKLLNAKDYTS